MAVHRETWGNDVIDEMGMCDRLASTAQRRDQRLWTRGHGRGGCPDMDLGECWAGQ